MIKVNASGSEGQLYVACLEPENINKLKAGNSVILKLEDLGGPKIDVMIMFGTTVSDVHKGLKDAGLTAGGGLTTSRGLNPSDVELYAC